MGVAYKKDIDDYRESSVIHIIEKLEEYGANWQVADPHVKQFKMSDRYIDTIAFSKDMVENADLVLITTDHTSFNYDTVAHYAKVIFDTRNVMKGKITRGKYYKL